MSTRSIIARPLNDVGWEGNYHHSNGYPLGVGATLYRAYHGYFQGDVDAMLRYMIDDHPGGWSSLTDADFTLPAGYITDYPDPYEDEAGYIRYLQHPRCYCHGDRNHQDTGHRSKIGDEVGEDWDIVFVYVVHKRGFDILVNEGERFVHDYFVEWNKPEPIWPHRGGFREAQAKAIAPAQAA